MRVIRYLRDALLFAPCYVALDWASYIHPLGPFNITPWNPQPALAIVWMLLGGLNHLPAVAATIFAADILVRGAPAGHAIGLAIAAILALGYGAIAAVLRHEFGSEPRFDSIRKTSVFAVVVALGSALVGAAFVGTLASAGLLREVGLGPAWFQFWIGDAAGILVTAPLLAAAADRSHRAELAAYLRQPDTLLQALALVATIALIFLGLDGNPATHFYLAFVPLIWIALRGGVAGVIIAMAIVQLGIVGAIHRAPTRDFPVLELQAFLVSLALASLYLGVAIDDRRRAADRLRQSLRLAAAGEMAGALAHELNQPLAALVNYGRSAQILVGRRAEPQQVAAVLERIVGEGRRAADIVRRLRDFFRAGATHLETVPADQIVELVRRVARETSGSPAVDVDVEGDVPELFVDRLQIELVMRNLIANAAEAVQPLAPESREIRVRARRHDPDHVAIVVSDSGPGPSPAMREKLFEPFASGKPTGLGLGLAVSRSIAEAHGGSLEAVGSGRGQFQLVLPCSRPK